MPLTFPGMNPDLENPDLWPELHHGLITAIAIALTPQIDYRILVAKEKSPSSSPVVWF